MPEPSQRGHLLIGPPGSGKSTLAAILAPRLQAQVISTDEWRQRLWGDAEVQGPWSELEPLLHEAMVSALAAGNNIVVDATHAQVSWRKRLMQQDLGVGRLKWIGWWLQTPLDQCLAWNRSRQRQVPEHVIRAMHRILTTPQGQPAKSEGFTNLIRLDYAGPDLNDQINLAFEIIHRHE